MDKKNIKTINFNWQLPIVMIPSIAGIILFVFILSQYFLLLGNPLEVLKNEQGVVSDPQQAKAALGQFGDYMGGVINPIIALFSLLALCLTILIQSKQLSQTTAAFTEQLDMTRSEKEFNEAMALMMHWEKLSVDYESMSKQTHRAPDGSSFSSVHPRKSEWENLSLVYKHKRDTLNKIIELRHEQLLKSLNLGVKP